MQTKEVYFTVCFGTLQSIKEGQRNKQHKVANGPFLQFQSPYWISRRANTIARLPVTRFACCKDFPKRSIQYSRLKPVDKSIPCKISGFMLQFTLTLTSWSAGLSVVVVHYSFFRYFPMYASIRSEEHLKREVYIRYM